MLCVRLLLGLYNSAILFLFIFLNDDILFHECRIFTFVYVCVNILSLFLGLFGQKVSDSGENPVTAGRRFCVGAGRARV